MEITHDVTIDLLRPRQNVIRVVQEDSTRTIRLKLLSNNQNYNVANDLDEGETLLKFVEFRKADGHGGMYDTTSTGETAVELEDQSVPNVWLVNLDGQCFTCPGWTQINVRFETESGKRIHTFAIMVDVEPTASSDTESTDWNDLESIAGLRNAVVALFEDRVTFEAKQAILDCFAHVAWVDEHGEEYYDALEAALLQTAKVVSISAVFDSGANHIYDTDTLDELRQYLTVTAHYEDLTDRVIVAYNLSGELSIGTSTITVSYAGKETSVNVTVDGVVLPSGYTRYDYIKMIQQPTTALATDRFIVLNTMPNLDVLSFDFLFSIVDYSASANYLWGVRTTTDYYTSFSVYAPTSNTAKLAVVARSTQLLVPGAIALNGKNRLKFTNPATSPMSASLNGGATAEADWTTAHPNNNAIRLFVNPAVSATTQKLGFNAIIGDLVLLDASGNIVAYYVPCVYNNRIGVYDGISQQFYTTSGANYSTIGNSNCLYGVGNWS